MKKFGIFVLTLVLCAGVLTGCHKHVSAAPATCTEPEICTECGKVMQEALGHEPGEAATCAAPQVCLRCGEILAPQLAHTSSGAATCTEAEVCTVCGATLSPALGHQVGGDGMCSRCGAQIVPAGQMYVAPGANGAVSDDMTGLLLETTAGGHYNAHGEPYYANAVLVCGDYGIEYFKPDPTGSNGYADTVNSFARKYPNIHLTNMLVPKCCAFEPPAGYDDPYEDMKSFISTTYDMLDDTITTADCMGVMTDHDGEYQFYRTDHHWTSLGAYYGSVAYCEANNIVPYALDTYETVYRTGYVGSLYMYGGNPAPLKEHPDYTVAHFPHVGYAMAYYNGGVQYNGLAVNGNSNSYAGMFICGDQPLTVITSDNKNGKTLLIFKESYGNAFVPYMIDYYERVVVVDIREDVGSVADIISRYNVTHALIINNCQGAISLCSNLAARIAS